MSVRHDHQEKLDALRREQTKIEQDLVDKYRNIVSGGRRDVEERGYYLCYSCLFQVIAAAEKHLKCIHQSSLKQLEEQHAKDCANSYKNLEKKANEQLKSNETKTKNKSKQNKPLKSNLTKTTTKNTSKHTTNEEAFK